ncbi:MAG: hypothetical protein AAFQ27_10630 [Pseudomonadota bacterium]
MLDGIGLSVVMNPATVMLFGAVISGAFALFAWRSVARQAQPDALSDLFKRRALQDQVRDPKLQRIRARGQRRTVRGGSAFHNNERDAMLHQVAAVMRGTERDAGIVREAKRYLAGEGFVILDRVAEQEPDVILAENVTFCEFEEVKLLPAPRIEADNAKAA